MMHDLPFQLVDESKLDEASLAALDAATEQYSSMFKNMGNGTNTGHVIPEYDEVLKAISTVIDLDYLYIHRVRERNDGSPLVVFSYVTFFGDRDALRARGFDPMDEYPSFVELKEDVLHCVCPIQMLHANCFNDLVMADTSTPMTTTTVPFYVSDPNDGSILSQFETDLMIEIN